MTSDSSMLKEIKYGILGNVNFGDSSKLKIVDISSIENEHITIS